jgi:anhydro-N-acetylmuramic acid kinase
MGDLINSKIWFSKPKLICGVMTGTSLDSIDIAFVKFEINNKGEHNFRFYDGKEIKFPKNYARSILKLINKNTNVSYFSSLNTAYSHIIANAIKVAIKSMSIKEEIDAIALHGQTVWHNPDSEHQFDINFGHTCQLGNGSIISSLVGIPVVYDFRSADVALGGNGAPLIPIFDYNFFKSDKEDIILLNIGGISNITFIPKNSNDDNISGFDTGAGNVLINSLTKKLFKKEFDKNGDFAKQGKLNKELLTFLLDDDFYSKQPPKSTGREKYDDKLVKEILDYQNKNNISDFDVIKTVTCLTARTIALNIMNFTTSNPKIIVSGGGRKNKELMFLLRGELKDYQIDDIDKYGINGDLKEAIGFAYLGWRTVGGMYGNLPAVTGASRKTRLGAIAI